MKGVVIQAIKTREGALEKDAVKIDAKAIREVELPDGTFIHLYLDLNCDCGPRRNKRDKSKMFVADAAHANAAMQTMLHPCSNEGGACPRAPLCP
ncbi:MAG: hypothetical protein JXR76_03535 [Deltaproteobacteria bacterium]|nr:hypothetical protein [Deltaproteobacteria bacterium]